MNRMITFTFKRLCQVLLLCLSFAQQTPMYAMDNQSDGYHMHRTDDNYTVYDMDDEDIDIDIIDIKKLPDHIITRSCTDCNLSHDLINGCVTIIDDINAIPVLKEAVYLRTHPLNSRNVLDLPLFPFYKKDFKRGIFSADLFYNSTSRVRFDENSTDISAYIALEEENLIRALHNAASKIRQDFFADFNVNIPAMFRLFSNLTIQERRAGLMLHFARNFERLTAQIKMPILYTERNFFLTDGEIERINRAKIPGICISTDGPLSDFAKQHMIADRFGLGDIRFTLGYKAVDKHNWKTTIGTKITVPTAFAFKRGLIGGSFEKCNYKPGFNICKLIDLAANCGEEGQTLAANMASNFFIGAVDQLASNLLDDPDGRHLRLGLFDESEIILNELFSIHSKNILEYFTPARAYRFFVRRNNYAGFRDRDFTDEDQAEDNLDFINEQLLNNFYPDVVQVKAKPGFLFRTSARVEFHKDRWILTAGSNLWWKQKERISTRNVPPALRDILDVEKGKRPEAYQSKVFGAIIYKKESEHRDWLISLATDGTTTASSIGEDISVSLGFEFNF